VKILNQIAENKFKEKEISEIINQCEVSKSQVMLTHGKQSIEIVSKPGEILCADVIGPYAMKYGLIVTDK